MEQGSTTTEAADTGLFAGEAWFDPIEAGIRERVRGFIEELLAHLIQRAEVHSAS
jgi:putative transposase